MATTRTHVPRQSLHISIDSSPYNGAQLQRSPESSPSSSSMLSNDTNGTTPTSSSSTDGILFSVLCMYDFVSDEVGHLPFHKNEILDVVKQEDTGWWAAMRTGGDTVGWIPQAFVNPLSEEMTSRLRNVREELRVYEYEAEQLYNSAPTVPLYDTEPQLSPEPARSWPEKQTIAMPARDEYAGEFRRLPYPPSPSTPMPQPPSISAPINKPTPPTPLENEYPVPVPRDRAGSLPSRGGPRNRGIGIGMLGGINEQRQRESVADFTPNGSPDPSRRRPDKLTRLTGSKEATVFHQAVQLQAHSPWFLRPRWIDYLQFDAEGQVRTGTVPALLEKLTSDGVSKDPIKIAQETAFRNIFLMTFRTFMSADDLFDGLVERYRVEPPNNLSESEFEEWKERLCLPTQRVVLTVFTMWLEDHRLLEEEPYIAQRLTDFLGLITKPPALAITAKLIVQSIERLTFANPRSPSPAMSPPKKRKSKPHKGDLLRLDPADIAEQLALTEYKLYNKVTPQECIKYAKTQTGKPVCNLMAFCATHDKLAAWVQSTILSNEALGKRADTVDFWIKVAEKCRNLNNFSSMCAVVNALSSTVITRLHLTWAHVNRKSNLDALLKLNDPSGGFAGYRGLQLNTEGPCIPFIGMYLTDIVHIQDQFNKEKDRISFVQCQRWYEVTTVMLRSQNRPYNIAENDDTMIFISNHLRSMSATSKDQAKFWARSQDVQQSELAHADIRRGLEAAGF